MEYDTKANKLLIHTPIYPPIQGGASSYFSNLVEELKQYEIEIIILTTSNKGSPTVSKKNNITIYRIIPQLNWFPVFLRIVIRTFISFLFCIYINKYEKVDVIHTHSTSDAVIGIGASTLVTGVPMIYDCRDADFRSWYIKFGNAKQWLACSTNIRHKLIDSGIRGEDITQIPVINSFDPDDFISNSEQKSNDTFKIIFVGSMELHKGPSLVIQSFAKLYNKSKNIELILIGDGTQTSKLKDLVNELNLDRKVKFKGQLPQHETLQEMAKADTLVLPSSREGMPRVIIEAIDLKIPVIASPVGDIPYYIRHGESGFLVSRDPDEIYQKLRILKNSEEVRDKLSTAALEDKEDISRGEIIRRLISLYSKY